jgi:hypothetical protein
MDTKFVPVVRIRVSSVCSGPTRCSAGPKFAVDKKILNHLQWSKTGR